MPSPAQELPSRGKKIKQRLMLLLAILTWVGVAYMFVWIAQQQNIVDADTACYYTPAVNDYQDGRYQEAIQSLRPLLKKYPGDYDNDFLMGQSLLKLKQYDEARRSFRAAIHDDAMTSHRWRGWEDRNAAQKQIDIIDRLTAPPPPKPTPRQAGASAPSLPPTPAQQAADRAAQKQSERTQWQTMSLTGALVVMMFTVGWVFTRPPSPDRIKLLWRVGIINSVVLGVALYLGFAR